MRTSSRMTVTALDRSGGDRGAPAAAEDAPASAPSISSPEKDLVAAERKLEAARGRVTRHRRATLCRRVTPDGTRMGAPCLPR